MSPAPRPTRRAWLAGAVAGAAGLAGCRPERAWRSLTGQDPPLGWTGGWVGDAVAVAHRWRDGAAPQATAAHGPVRKVDVLVVGGGVAGLAASRALRQAGIEDLAVLELHTEPGGNSRGHRLAGTGCPLGAHYLPVPGTPARELLDWLHELGVARQVLGRTVWDERLLCHAPQERLWFDGAWHAGLLPPLEPGSAGARQARQLAARIEALGPTLGFSLPSTRSPWTPGHAALDGQTFAHWLGAEGIDDPALRWYLDYACRDDYGAPADTVSAWAGIHYFASRHGFRPPGEGGEEAGDPGDGVLTWPEGNAWLVARLAEGLGERLATGRLATRIAVGRHAVEVDAWRTEGATVERWQAREVVLALPLMVLRRVLESPPATLQQAVSAQRLAPWLVANVVLAQPPFPRPGLGQAWDSVVFGRTALGYVHAQHQALAQPGDGPLVLTAYHALDPTQRAALQNEPWSAWAERVVDELAVAHPDLPPLVRQVDLARHGHAMSTPVPGLRGHAALQALRSPGAPGDRLHLAHADLVGYSVFEEAFTLGTLAGAAAARALGQGRPRSI